MINRYFIFINLCSYTDTTLYIGRILRRYLRYIFCPQMIVRIPEALNFPLRDFYTKFLPVKSSNPKGLCFLLSVLHPCSICIVPRTCGTDRLTGSSTLYIVMIHFNLTNRQRPTSIFAIAFLRSIARHRFSRSDENERHIYQSFQRIVVDPALVLLATVVPIGRNRKLAMLRDESS